MSSDGSEDTDKPKSDSQQNRWPSILSLLGGSRQQTEKPEETGKIDEELSCPICQDLMKEVYVTHCGHSFCHECISLHLDNQSDCPMCRSELNKNNIYPNFQLNKLAAYRIQSIKESQPVDQHLNPIEKLIIESKKSNDSIANTLANSLSCQDLISVFETALSQRRRIEQDENKIKQKLLVAFLEKLEKKNRTTVRYLLNENNCITSDLQYMICQNEQHSSSLHDSKKRKLAILYTEDELDEKDDIGCSIENEGVIKDRQAKSERQYYSTQDEQQLPLYGRLNERFDDLSSIYHSLLSPNDNINKRRKLLNELSTSIYELTRYNQFDVIDTIDYTDGNRLNSSIVSTIGFDRDQELIAVGGVTREIKLFDFNMMGYSTGHCPLRVLVCGHKISCLSWSPYIKSQLASSDYEGHIDIWDCSTGRKVHTFNEHKKRAWSVDYCETNPTLLASGSDDSTVKVWSLSQNKAIHTLEQKGNVCCAKFAPNNSYYLAVGSADHHVSCYDLRYPTHPLSQFVGHKKAVSYVKWLNDNEIVSAQIHRQYIEIMGQRIEIV
ncbi:hypothetical protein [Parasitella parasitica]|uniref:RING-type domain-containing protein n=1 Tax=Parasitella parasitica TaxID=35722 RepID=A0A0B7MZ40_9FUNG|nr:hypothetical protein [Parasitella parasitica]